MADVLEIVPSDGEVVEPQDPARRLVDELGAPLRVEHDHAGSVPLNSLSTRIDYGYAIARTTAGTIGVRVWVNHGRYQQQKEG